MDAWGLFLTAHAVLVEAIERRLADAELPSLVWYDALWALERAPEQRLRMFEFEKWMVISRSNITRIIDRMEAASYVARERSSEDGRGAYAVLTMEGQTMRQKMWGVYQQAIQELFDARLNEQERAVLETVMRRLLEDRSAVGEGGE